MYANGSSLACRPLFRLEGLQGCPGSSWVHVLTSSKQGACFYGSLMAALSVL